ncbi:MAG: transposase [Caldilineaceae bacterium]
MRKAFKYRLYPSQSQAKTLDATLETCRRFYNDCLAERKAAYEDEQRTIGKFEQLRKVKTLKEINPYAKAIHSHVLQVVVADLDKAFQAFFRRIKSGETPGYPRFKGHNRFDSFGFKEYGNGFRLDGRRLKLSGIGRIAVRWHRPLPEGTRGQIKTVRVIRKAGHWYACFACEVEAQPLEPTGQSVGIDVGLASVITTSNGEKKDNPRWYRQAQAKLRVIQRRVARRKKGGSNRRKAVLRLQRQHERIQNQRRDYLNKLAYELIQQNDFIAIEDLQVTNMVRNRHLSKSIMDAGWGYFRQRLEAKAVEAGRTIVAIPPAYTSKTCSNCGTIFEHLTLDDRWVECACGLSLDRDHNAAINMLRVGRTLWASTWHTGACVAQEAAGL